MPERMTRFEKTRIISARALQIAAGAPILMKTDSTDPREIARMEFENNLLPMMPKKKAPRKLKDSAK